MPDNAPSGSYELPIPVDRESIARVLLPRRRSDVLTRQRLLDLLYELVDRKLVLVSAPAGYGKTTLLLDFAHDLEHPVCWYALDESDRDPHIFLEHLILSLHHRFPEFGERTQRALAASPDLSGGAPGVVHVLMNEMLDLIPRWFVLVLDDYHSLQEAPEIGAILARCLSYQTGQFLLIVSSRTIPALPSIVQLTAKSEVAGFGVKDLRFDASEIQGLLAQNYKLHIPEQEAEALAAQSEGWITGILLTAHTMWRGILERLVQANTSDQPVYEYLAQEVLYQQPHEIQAFLTASSILQEMSPTLCREALGLEDAERIFPMLEERNLFITRLEGEWYRYHHLFQEYLQSRLKQGEESRWIELHRRAAAWFQAHDRAEMAVHHYLAIEDVENAARIMEATAPDMFYAGRMTTLAAWGAKLPEPLHERVPRLALFEARAADALGWKEDALALTQIAERGYRAVEDSHGLAYALLHRCEIWQGQGRFEEAQALGEQVLALVQETGATATYEALRILGRSSLTLGRLDQGEEYLRQSLSFCQKEATGFEQAIVTSSLAECVWRQGRWEEAIVLQQEAVATQRRLNNAGALAGALNDLGFYLYSTGQYQEALRFLEESLALARQAGFRRVEAFALTSLGELRRDLGDLDGAVNMCEAALAIADDLGEGFLSAYGRDALGMAFRARGEYPKARAIIQRALERAQEQHSEYQLGRYGTSLGLVLAQSGNVAAGLTELSQARNILEQIGARGELARAHFFTAWTLYQAGHKSEATIALQHALEMNNSSGRDSLFVVEGWHVLPLLQEAHKQGIGGQTLAAIVARAKNFERRAGAILQEVSPPEAKVAEPLRILGFGQGRVEIGGTEIPVSEWEAAATRYLLFYLLVYPSRSRDQIAAALWPELEARKVKATFHTTKFRLKRALGCDALYFDGRNYQIHPDFHYWFDVSEFLQLLDKDAPDRRLESLQQAIDLYSSDFLEDCYADWCAPYRETLRERYLDALDELADMLMRRRQYRQAARIIRQGLELDDLREEFHRRLMLACALSGKRGQAAAQYKRCAAILRAELGADPSPETTALYRRIVEGHLLD